VLIVDLLVNHHSSDFYRWSRQSCLGPDVVLACSHALNFSSCRSHLVSRIPAAPRLFQLEISLGVVISD
jgi:hypothetical protein